MSGPVLGTEEKVTEAEAVLACVGLILGMEAGYGNKHIFNKET